MCCLRKELPYGSINDTKLRDLLHGEAIVSPNPKIISSIIKQSEYFDEEILKKANNRFYTLDEFDTALKSFNLASQLFCMHFNISSISYHHLELYNLLFNVKIKSNIIGIFETRLQRGKQPTTNISLPNYVYEHTPTESGKRGTLLYIDKNVKYKLHNGLTIYEKKMVESTFIEILNKKQKNMIIGCVYKHPKHEVSDFTNNFITPLLDKLSNENKDIMIMGDFTINLINYNDDKNTGNFLDTMFSQSFLPYITTPTRITRNTKTFIDNIYYNKPLNSIISGNLSSIISDKLIQFLIEAIDFSEKSSKMINRQRCYKIFDKLKFKSDLVKVNWDGFCLTSNPNDALAHFLKIVNKRLDKHVPYKTIKYLKTRHETKPWITPGLANSIRNNHKLYKSFCKERDPKTKEYYEKQFKSYRNHISSLLRKTKDSYYKQCMEDSKNILV